MDICVITAFRSGKHCTGSGRPCKATQENENGVMWDAGQQRTFRGVEICVESGVNRGNQDCGEAQRRRSRQGINTSKGPEAGIGLDSWLSLDHEVWLQLVSEVGAEGRELTG